LTDAHAWAARLASGEAIDEPVALVVAHPDDETLFAGPALSRLTDLRLILVTDGAPEDMGDAHRLGFATCEAYAAARRDELDAALAALGATPDLRRYDMPDQQAVHRLRELTDRLAADLAGTAVVLTHPYEGGHPDHDAVACAVARAVERLGPDAPAIVEFACYASFDGERVFWRFVDHVDRPAQARALSATDGARVEAALAAHASQRSVFGTLRPDAERWRAAPAYDFTAPAPGETCLYDGFGWTLTSAKWRALAAAGR
jgi:LmbE family N-acetylglucosaminyl deacetylase